MKIWGWLKTYAVLPVALVALAIGSLALGRSGCGGPSPGPAPSPPLPISLPAQVTMQPGVMTIIEAETRGENRVHWHAPAGVQLLVQSRVAAIVCAQVPGQYQLLAWTALDGAATDAAECRLMVGQPGPIPPGPIPPGPTPIPGDGLRVLLVYESAELSKLPREQALILTSQPVRSYLAAKCVKVGATPEYRFLDKDAVMTSESPVWQETMKRPRATLPWVVIGDGKRGFEGPLPPNADAFLELLKTFGG